MSEARSLLRADLPGELQQRHGSLSTNEQRVLQALKDHTGLILRGIRSNIGQDCHLQRASLVQEILGKLEEAQVVIVSGPSGIGKSAIGKAAVSLLSQDHFVMGFRAEEFAQPHFDVTLHAAQIPANATTLGAILAGQSRKVVLVESVERLLEKTTRDAFSDLMTLAAADRGMRIVLTCRDYSIDQVRVSFLHPAGMENAVASLPLLDDMELTEVEADLPALAYPLKNPALRNILRNPYYLDKALEIAWSEERPVPESEREFRALFWLQIVRSDHRVPAGMARQREEVFQEVALRRARALSAYVNCKDLDPTVVEALRHDSLIVSPDDKPLLVATAHDVLEDWAILHWIGEQHLTNEGSFRELSAVIGTYPAVRRCYRKWVADLVDRDHAAADRLFKAAIVETEISVQFREDTLVALLKAPSSPDFLEWHEAQLMANERALLKRVIHLLRVACMKMPVWMEGTKAYGWIYNVPEGPAWATVLSLVHRNIGSFTPQERPLLLGLIEDAVRNVSWWAPELDGAEFVAGIGHWLLSGFDYSSGEQRKRVLKVIAKIPKADSARFEAILRGNVEGGQRRDRIAEDFREIIFSGMDGMPAARDRPDLLVSVAADYLLASEDGVRRDRFYGSSTDLEMHFGIKEGLRHDFYPPSAFRGPWFHLLWHHPRQGIDFFIKVFNHSADWYAHPRVHDRLESAWEIELTFADGTTRKQWGNQRLWSLYRGTSVGPYALQSMLMALEKWLLEFAGNYPEQLDAILVDILRRSDSAAQAAVVASVATAHPHSSGEALLVLLSAPDYIKFDHARMATEFQASTLSGIFPQFKAENEIHEAERKEANQLAHRGQDLEVAVTNLQLGPLASRVHAILDGHLAALPPKSEQDKSDLIWRLALHRMDLRQYTISDAADQEILEADANADEPTTCYFRLEPKAPEADVQAMVDEHAAQSSAMAARLGILMWGIKVFERENGNYDPSLWRQKLADAQTMDREAEQQYDSSRNGPGFVAAVCVRDHWDEMSVDEREWCMEVVCSEILRQSDHWNHLERVQRYSMVADRPSALVVSVLLSKSLTEPQKVHVRKAFAAALTHPNEEVRSYATWGIDEKFWTVDSVVALRCVNAIATEAALIDQRWRAEQKRPFQQRRSFDEIGAEAATAIRQRFWQEGEIAEDAHSTVDISEGFGAEANARMLAILGQVPNDPISIAAFARASRTLVDWWDAHDDWERRRERNYEAEAAISQCLQRFLMRTTPASALEVLRPVLDAIDRHPREIHSIVRGLTVIEDSWPNTPQYWFLWNVFADAIKRAKWVSQMDDDRSFGSEMLSAIFLTSGWKDNVRHWRSLEGYAHHVHAFFEALPPSSIVLDAYVRFLFQVGEQSLPEAFVRVADSLKRGDAQAMLRRTDTVFLLEVLLQRHVYGKPLELKRNPNVREAVLFLLDILVENGSSAAFHMRDDFVTPGPS